MVKKGKNKRKVEIMREILKEKGLTKKEWREECVKRGMSEKTFYYHFPLLKKRREIKFIPNEKIWVLLSPPDRADPREIKLCIDEMECKEERIRNLGVEEFVRLCRDKVVIHDPRLKYFFRKSLCDNSFNDIHEKLLRAFRYVIAHILKDENYEMLETLLNENKDVIMDFVKSGSLKLKRKAMSILALTRDKDALNLLFEIIKESTDEDYRDLKEDVWENFQFYFNDHRIEIKTKLYEIATAKKSTDSITDRAIDLLSRFSPDYKVIRA